MSSSGAKFTIAGTPSSPRGYDSAAAAVLALTLEQNPAVDVTSCSYFVAAQSPGAPAPSFSNSGVASPVNATVQLTLPNAPGGGAYTWSWIIRCQTNGGAGVPQADGSKNYLINTYDRIVTVKTAINGLRAIIYGESTEYSSDSWAKSLNDLMLAVENGGLGLTVSIAPVASTISKRGTGAQLEAAYFTSDVDANVASSGLLRMPAGNATAVAAKGSSHASVPLLALGGAADTVNLGDGVEITKVNVQGAALQQVVSITVPSAVTWGFTQLSATAGVSPTDQVWSAQPAFSGDAKHGAGMLFTMGASGDAAHHAGTATFDLGALDNTGSTLSGSFILKADGGTILQVNKQTVSAQFYTMISTGPSPSQMFVGNFDSGTRPTGLIAFQGTTADSGQITLMVEGNSVIQCAHAAGVRVIGLYGASPVAQASRAGQLTNSTGVGAPGTTVSDVGGAFAQSTLNTNFAAIALQYNKIETMLHNLGLSA